MDPDTALERVNYFQGQMLTASDLRAEQEYFLARFRHHNRYLHGWGVVSGLKARMLDSADPSAELICRNRREWFTLPVAPPARPFGEWLEQQAQEDRFRVISWAMRPKDLRHSHLGFVAREAGMRRSRRLGD